MWAEAIGSGLCCARAAGDQALGSWGGPVPYSLLQAHSLLPHPQFVDTPGNLPPSMNLSQLLGLKRNLSIHLAYE